jgi:hypothetical protein
MPKYATPRVPQETLMYEIGVDGVPRLTRVWMIFFERLGRIQTAAAGGATITRQKATFGLLRDLVTDENDLTNHYIARGGGVLRNWTVNAKVPPSGQDAILDIQRSVDEGENWFSIFREVDELDEPTDEFKIIIPADDDSRIDGTDFAADDEDTEDIVEGRIDAGDFLRINCVQAGSTEPGSDIEVVLEWWEDAA